MDKPFTLRELYGLVAPARVTAATTGLLLVDFQLEFLTGRLVVEGGRAALELAVTLLMWARRHAIAVVHVRHVALRADSPVFAEGSPTAELAIAPIGGELVVTKHQAGGFSGTELHALLQRLGVDTVIVAGIMTHLAVDVTARDAAVLGYRVLVVADACATRALPSAIDDDVISAHELHRTALAALADRFADVVGVADVLALPCD